MSGDVKPTNEQWDAILADFAPPPEPVEPEDAPALPEGLEDLEIDSAPSGTYTSPKSEFVANLDILSVYTHYVDKGPIPKQRGTNIKVRCPTPQHVDADPSACLETDRNVWVCYGCDAKGGTYEIAAYHYGYDVPSYRNGPSFREVVEHMANDFGYAPGVTEVVILPEGEDEPAPEEPVEADLDIAQQITKQHLAAVIELKPEHRPQEEEDFLESAPPFAWDDIFDRSGFRYAYMYETAIGRIFPHEFFASGADVALGMASGHNVYIQGSVRTYANVYSSLIGHTGSGKSISTVPLKMILEDVMPFNKNNADAGGVKFLPQVGSGEALVAQMKAEGIDEDTGQPCLVPVKGFMYVDELASYIGRMNRKGSILQPMLIEMYGAVDERRMANYSMTGGSYECTRPFLSFVTGVQPQAMKGLMGDAELVNGFLNRFVIYVAHQPDIPDDFDATMPNPFTLDMSTGILREIVDWAAQRKGPLEWESKAREEFMRVYRRRIFPINLGNQPELARLSMILMKMVLLCAADVMADTITVDHVQRATEHMNYVAQGLAYAASTMGATLIDECAEKLVRGMMRKGGGWMTKKMVREFVRKGKYADVWEKAMTLLIDLEVVESRVTKKARGPAGVEYRLAPTGTEAAEPE